MPDAAPVDPITALSAQIERLAQALDARTVAPEGLSPKEAAAFLGVSVSKLHELDGRGLLPSPAQIGDRRCPRYSASELKAWLLAGAPSRQIWRATRESALKRISA